MEETIISHFEIKGLLENTIRIWQRKQMGVKT